LARYGADKLKGKLDELRATITGSKYPFAEQFSGPITLLEQAVGKTAEWYLTDFALGDDLLDAKESVVDPIQSFLNGAQRTIYDQAVALLATHNSNLNYLSNGSDEAVQTALVDPNAFRSNRMALLKQATDQLRTQIDEVVTANRASVTIAIGARKAELVASDFYEKATAAAQQSVIQRIDQTLSQVHEESQIALILQIGTEFEASVYPSLLDQLPASQQGGGGVVVPPTKRTVSIKTVTVSGASGVLETDDDVDKYLIALRAALLQTLNDGKRIAL
jgi:hypothetical protein